ncbi:hypothetical protein NKH52_10800 [Mesorhizobium sp. M1066]|uniref:hypothetical protein n=1 Tax=unclassified Mesorhizobium TaxID=325217 RepID=UPI00333AE9C8
MDQLRLSRDFLWSARACRRFSVAICPIHYRKWGAAAIPASGSGQVHHEAWGNFEASVFNFAKQIRRMKLAEDSEPEN